MGTTFTHFTDHDLLQLIRKQDEQAFEALYERYYLLLYKKAFQRIPVKARVEEIVEDVFVNLWRKAETLDPDGNIKAYLYATLRNKILHDLRTEGNRSHYMKKWKEQQNRKQAKATVLQDIYAEETEKVIHGIIMKLPPQCKKAFQLSRYEQLSYKEIANEMGISTNTVEKHIGKALYILRSKLKPS